MERRLPQFFFALSLIALALMLGAVWQAGTPAWKTYQQEFHRREAAGEPNAYLFDPRISKQRALLMAIATWYENTL